ncbi:MAG: UDP-N-acetylmuramoyl-tripeptide--D-alanyl-D-alanine ligase [Pseudomonadota bacterium]
MIHGQLEGIATAIGAELRGGPGEFRGVKIDTRLLSEGALFVALPGTRVDGHDYLEQAAAAGASAALVQRFVECELPQLRCVSSERGLATLAAHWRKGFAMPLVGITGSNGKTTVKTMLAQILQVSHRVLVTQGNLNNELGVPLTLCGLDSSHDFAVVEMGAGKPGDIAYLGELARPDVSLLTNAGPAHLEGMGDLAGVARTKGEIVEALGPAGVAILNADDPFFDFWCGLAGSRRVVSFGLEQPADVTASWRSVSSGMQVNLATSPGEINVTLRSRGGHNAANAAAATAAALALGISLEDIAAGLEAFEPVDGRLKFRAMPGGWQLLQDSYNANPASMSAGLKVLAAQPGQRWLIMGDMRELGAEAEALHFQVGSEARRLGITRLFALGPLSRHSVAGFDSGSARHFASLDDLAAALGDALTDASTAASTADDSVVCLLKGSRGMRMERVVDALAERGLG